MCVCVFVYFLVLIFYTLGSALTHLPRPLVAFACPKDLYLPERSTKKPLLARLSCTLFLSSFLTTPAGRLQSQNLSTGGPLAGLHESCSFTFRRPRATSSRCTFDRARARAHAKQKRRLKYLRSNRSCPLHSNLLLGR